MSGYIARKGFRYQDLYLLLRVLEAAGAELERGWGTISFPSCLENLTLRFGIEATAEAGALDQLDWDVLIESPAELELAELKSGSVGRNDRLSFWRRVRREGAAGLCHVRPTLVVDPDTAGQLEYFASLAETAKNAPLSTPELFDGNVTSTEKLLKEAMWSLCGPGKSSDGDPLDSTVAQEIVARFSLRTIRAAELEERVESLIEILWPASLASVYEPLLVGWLGKRATTLDPARRLFTLRELFADIGVLTHATAFNATRLQSWQTLWMDLPGVVQARTRGRLGQSGEAVPSRDIQPSAVDVLSRGNAALIIRGIGGAGKSTFLAQAVQAAEARGELVLWCGADDPSTSEIDAIVDAFRFRSSISRLRYPERICYLVVDGLDEASANKRERWAELLSRLATVKAVRVIASVRDTVLRRDASLRKKFDVWTTLDLGEWPPSVVERLLASTSYAGKLPSSVLSLLRTPILLDLFWRTFVENPAADLTKAAKLSSRHELLAAFWDQRLINAPRYASIHDMVPTLAAVFDSASKTVGSFYAASDAATVLLLSEGVLVTEGRLQPRLNFRHPLLRDFAFAQWILFASSPMESAQRWASIAGGLRRYGALRALAEALTAPDAANEYVAISLPAFLQALIAYDPAAAAQVAQLLGSLTETRGLEPMRWPAGLQAVLPSGFGSAVLSAARLNENPAWATVIENWPTNLSWIDDNYLHDLWRYADMLLGKSKKDTTGQWTLALQIVTRRLRALSDDPRFATSLAAAQEWLSMQVTNCVAESLPDLETLTWLERRLPHAGWRVRSFILDHLAGLASVDAGRTACLFRVVIGLNEPHRELRLDPETWGSIMSQHAIDWSLAGEKGSASLLAGFPVAFFPVALDLAHALWEYKRSEQSSTERALDEIIDSIDPTLRTQNSHDAFLGALIDDQPQWFYWGSLSAGDARQRCIHSIHNHAKVILQSNPELFYSAIAPLLRRSPLATVQSIALDLLLEQRTDPRSHTLLRDAVLDDRLYGLSGSDYWLQQLLISTWPGIGMSDRETIQKNIAVLLRENQTVRRAKRLLACLPAAELRADLAAQRPSETAPESKRVSRPRRNDRDDGSIEGELFDLISDPTPKVAPGIWSEHFDQATLLLLHNSSDVVRKSGVTADELRAELPNAVSSALVLAPLLLSDQLALIHDENVWIWDAFEKTLAAYHKLREQPDFSVPPSDLVRACAMFGLAVLRDIPANLPGELPESNVWAGFRENAWTRALDLIDEALVWDPAQNDGEFQSEFIAIIKRAFGTGDPLLQLVCATRIRPYHWLRNADRRELFRQLVLEAPSDSRILEWSIGMAAQVADPERTEFLRLALNRGDLREAKKLADRLGDLIGVCSLLVLDSGHRSSSAELVREIIVDPSRFALLRDGESACEFWHSFAFGLKEQAKRTPSLSHLASDYGHWLQAAWQFIRRHQTTNRSDAVVLFAAHWMERSEASAALILLPWWESIQPLFAEVINEGSAADCFNIFFNFRDGPFNHLMRPDELLGFVDRFVNRISTAVSSHQIDLDARNPTNDEHHSWKECANYAAQSIDALNQEGLLQTELLRDHAHRLLSWLAAAPICSSDAATALHSLQRD